MMTHYHKNDLPYCILSRDFLTYDRRVTACHTCTYGTAYRHCARVHKVLEHNTHIHCNALPHITSRIILSAWQSVLTLSIKKCRYVSIQRSRISERAVLVEKSLVCSSGNSDVWVEPPVVEWQRQGKTEVPGENPVPGPFGSPQISHVQTWDRTPRL
jgi:hypothetical protein